MLVTGYYGDLGPALPVLAGTAVEALAVDLVSAPGTSLAAVPGLAEKTVVAGLVDGRNVWRTDLVAALAAASSLAGIANEGAVSTSTSENGWRSPGRRCARSSSSGRP
jgi:5-methyltetrahydropteroyltriglutamate--homocysteine methyltransferase